MRVEQGQDIVGLVINEALHVAVEGTDEFQTGLLGELQRDYYRLVERGLRPTPAARLAHPLRDAITDQASDVAQGFPLLLSEPDPREHVLTSAQILHMEFYRGQERLHLTATERRIAAVLMAHRREIVLRDDLIGAVFVGELKHSRALNVHIRRLRSKLDDPDTKPEDGVIQCVRDVGYSWVDPNHRIHPGPFPEANPHVNQ